ncbi:MAG TPA: cytochrome c [Saprospiraceae bacterium]|nr:cytochrome c [Saprospiraceae bacterium]HPN69569.1 cytochrome c [Saprospiraceae bacterium]
MIKYLIVVAVCSISVLFPAKNTQLVEDYPMLTDLEMALGKDFGDKKPNMSIKGVSAEAGESLVKNGFATNASGKKTKQQSKHFVCTSCHNVEREDPNMAVNDAQARLLYTNEKGLPYLQGTALYGAVNRNTYYNGDYYKKYGDLVYKAKNNVREAIQLCAQECAQGRKLKDWELESILAYLWKIGLKTSDIQLSETEKTDLGEAVNNKEKQQEALFLVSKKYLDSSAATFVVPPVDRDKGNGLNGDVENGKLIYKNSCLYCHDKGRYSYLSLDEGSMSRNYLKKHIGTYHRQSVYQVVRWGVPVKSGKKSYMPQYPVEKLSEQQLADLVAFINN